MLGRICGMLTLAAVMGLTLPAVGQIPVSRAKTATTGSTARPTQLPYTAEFKSTRVQMLADGSTITHETTEVMARDSQGRTLNLSSVVSTAEDQSTHTTVNIDDPVARTHTYWFVPGQRVTVTNTQEAGSERSSCDANTLAPMPRLAENQRVKPKTEDLGTQTFEGVEARGHRNTWRYPAGSIGNSVELVRTSEVWVSTTPGFSGINVHQVNDDPRNSKQTRELVKFTPGEPDGTLFQPPHDYEVVTQEMHDEVRCPQ